MDEHINLTMHNRLLKVDKSHRAASVVLLSKTRSCSLRVPRKTYLKLYGGQRKGHQENDTWSIKCESLALDSPVY